MKIFSSDGAKAMARWACFAPLAVAAAIFILVLNRAWMLFVMSDSLFRSVVVEAMPNAIAGAVLIEVGYFIAPARKRLAAFALFVLLVLYAGFGLAAAMLADATWQAYLAMASMLSGAATSMYLKDDRSTTGRY